MNQHDANVSIKRLLTELLASTVFEDAAAVALRPMLDLAERALADSEFKASGKIVRAMIHLRPDDGYRRLVVLEAGKSGVSAIAASKHLPSTTAWRWVSERRHAVAVDVDLGRVQVDDADPNAIVSDKRRHDHEFSGNDTRMRLLDRDVSHLYVLPLRGLGGSVDGMISLEADCRQAMGRTFVWSRCSAELQTIADLAAPYLTRLPSRPMRAADGDPLLPVIGASMADVVEMLRVFAQQEEPILVSGPTGAGKSRLARWCHEQSQVKDQAFEALDLSAVPEELQLAELFGWKKGAFTGAVRDNPGVIARARGGTLFIDEIDNLSPRAQAGLLHVLEERSYRMLGDEGAERRAEVRFIIGTNARLQEAVRSKRFREDLYYRINVLPIRLPPLDARPDEIPLWARYMATRHHDKRVSGGAARLSPGAERILAEQPWPGNLRQLDNIVRRAYALASMAHGASLPHDIELGEKDVRRALTYEGLDDGKRPVLEAVLAAASALVAEAQRRAGDGTPIDCDVLDGFKGLVLGTAVEKSGGSRDDAFRLLGKEKLVKARNHHKVLKRELERAQELCEAIGAANEFPFAALLSAPDPEKT